MTMTYLYLDAKPIRTRASRNSIVMVGSDFLADIPPSELAPKVSTNVTRDAMIDPVSVSERVLIEAAAERGRVSEVQDREKVVCVVVDN